LPNDLQVEEFYQQEFGCSPSPTIFTHLKRELMQAIWALILDDELMHTYEHGLALQYSDGIMQRLFARFYTYSMDYLKKVLLATILCLGQCPCPHCFIEKEQI
ncbi:hypothetical protein K435DRAFT_649906, partial [Dendrothele bispora CBS 962.96]